MKRRYLFGLAALLVLGTAFAASPELRAYAANTIGSADIIDESILSEDIKNGQVKASDIATDAVTADEIKGVSKLLFGQCSADSTEGNVQVFAGDSLSVKCTITGTDDDDSAIAVKNSGNNCFDIRTTSTDTDQVSVVFKNTCSNVAKLGIGTQISVIVYDK